MYTFRRLLKLECIGHGVHYTSQKKGRTRGADKEIDPNLEMGVWGYGVFAFPHIYVTAFYGVTAFTSVTARHYTTVSGKALAHEIAAEYMSPKSQQGNIIGCKQINGLRRCSTCLLHENILPSAEVHYRTLEPTIKSRYQKGSPMGVFQLLKYRSSTSLPSSSPE